jgi:hypothetical protein
VARPRVVVWDREKGAERAEVGALGDLRVGDKHKCLRRLRRGEDKPSVRRHLLRPRRSGRGARGRVGCRRNGPSPDSDLARASISPPTRSSC